METQPLPNALPTPVADSRASDPTPVLFQCLSRLEVLRTPGLSQHARRVGCLAAELCGAVGLDRAFAQRVAVAAPFHDIGKLVIPDAILHKPGPLSADEMTVMRSHCAIGHEALRGAGDPVIELAASMALTHHECYDGSGYPLALAGDEIPIEGRILAVCDVYDALRQERAYKRGLPHEAATGIILRGDGRTAPQKFDPGVLAAFDRLAPRFAEIWAADALPA